MSWDEVLGIAPTASEIEIAAAFRRLAKQVHPDVAPTADDATRRARALEMATLNEAYREARAAAAARRVVTIHAAPVLHTADADPEPSVAPPAAHEPPAPPPDPTVLDSTEPEPIESAREPAGPRWGWRLVGVALVAALAFGVVTAQSTSAPDTPIVDNCVVWSGSYHRAPCSEPHAGRIVLTVDEPAQCPSGSSYMHAAARVLCINVSE